MKTTVLATDDVTLAPAAGGDSVVLQTLQNIAAAWRQARAERRLRRDLAELDDRILQDIGVCDDEIARVHAGDTFTPRNWQA